MYCCYCCSCCCCWCCCLWLVHLNCVRAFPFSVLWFLLSRFNSRLSDILFLLLLLLRHLFVCIYFSSKSRQFFSSLLQLLFSHIDYVTRFPPVRNFFFYFVVKNSFIIFRHVNHVCLCVCAFNFAQICTKSLLLLFGPILDIHCFLVFAVVCC